MRPSQTTSRRHLSAVAACSLFLACALLVAVSLPSLPLVRRIDAESRWAERPFADYRIAVRVEASGTTCTQELETSGERIRRIISNNCRLSWLSLMTVARLFEISERLEQPAPCYATLQTCLCHRIRTGDVRYDARWGFPSTIVYRREVRPNLAGLEYWRRVWETHHLPNCGPSDQQVRIMIVALTPRADQ